MKLYEIYKTTNKNDWRSAYIQRIIAKKDFGEGLILILLLILYFIIVPPLKLWNDFSFIYENSKLPYSLIAIYSIEWVIGLIFIVNFIFFKINRIKLHFILELFLAFIIAIFFLGFKSNNEYRKFQKSVLNTDFENITELKNKFDEFYPQKHYGLYNLQIQILYDNVFYDFAKQNVKEHGRFNYGYFDEYIAEFPSGDFLDSALILSEYYHYKEIEKNRNFDTILLFENKYKESSYLDSIRSIKEEEWGLLFEYFRNIAQEYMIDTTTIQKILNALKENNTNIIYVNINGATDLKGIDDYNQVSYNLQYKDIRGIPNLKEPSEKNVESLKEYGGYGLFPDYDIVQGLNMEMGKFINNGFITFKWYHLDTINKHIVFTINYTLRDKKTEDGIPLLRILKKEQIASASYSWVFDVETVFELSIEIDDLKLNQPNLILPFIDNSGQLVISSIYKTRKSGIPKFQKYSNNNVSVYYETETYLEKSSNIGEIALNPYWKGYTNVIISDLFGLKE